jgi:hypothetical protein
MSFIKGFGIGLVVFIALNFVFSLIIAAVSGVIGTFFTDLADLNTIFNILFGPTSATAVPYLNANNLYFSIATGSTSGILTYIFYFVSPLVASILAGKFAGGKRFAALAWFLIAMLSAGLLLIPQFLILPPGTPLSLIGATIFSVLIAGVINGVFYATFAMLVSESEFY